MVNLYELAGSLCSNADIRDTNYWYWYLSVESNFRTSEALNVAIAGGPKFEPKKTWAQNLLSRQVEHKQIHLYKICNADLITYKEEPLASHKVLNLRFDDDGLSAALGVRPL